MSSHLQMSICKCGWGAGVPEDLFKTSFGKAEDWVCWVYLGMSISWGSYWMSLFLDILIVRSVFEFAADWSIASN